MAAFTGNKLRPIAINVKIRREKESTRLALNAPSRVVVECSQDRVIRSFSLLDKHFL